jgi:hypothetical protein
VTTAFPGAELGILPGQAPAQVSNQSACVFTAPASWNRSDGGIRGGKPRLVSLVVRIFRHHAQVRTKSTEHFFYIDFIAALYTF